MSTTVITSYKAMLILYRYRYLPSFLPSFLQKNRFPEGCRSAVGHTVKACLLRYLLLSIIDREIIISDDFTGELDNFRSTSDGSRASLHRYGTVPTVGTVPIL